MKCKICEHDVAEYFKESVLKKYQITYYRCGHCGFIFTEEPYWLEEAYALPINISDTGLLFRNNFLAKLTACLFYLGFNPRAKYLDYAGGYGVYTRLMRDTGFDFYWSDPYCKNLFAIGFESKAETETKYEAVTTFESFEHFVSPVSEVEKMLTISDSIVFSTELHEKNKPVAKEWWYFSFGHGQHVSLYTKEALQALAERFGKNFYSVGNLHIITDKVLSGVLLQAIKFFGKNILFEYVRKQLHGKTMEDHFLVKEIEEKLRDEK